VPTRLEPEGKIGITAALGTMLGEGTSSMTADPLADAFADLGNNVNLTGFYTIALSADRSIALMADQLMHLPFPDEGLVRVMANQLALLTRSHESPYYLTSRASAKMVIVIAGDRRIIEPGVRAANVAPVVVIDDDGNRVQ
jgi:hypothetical protein